MSVAPNDGGAEPAKPDPVNATQQARRVRLIAQCAMRGADVLHPADKIELLLGLAELLPAAEAEVARVTAFVIQESEAQQLKFREMLGLEDPPPT